MNAAQRQEKIHGQRFKIVWSENNLRYLATDPDSEEKRRRVALNLQGIEDAKAEIARLEQEATP